MSVKSNSRKCAVPAKAASVYPSTRNGPKTSIKSTKQVPIGNLADGTGNSKSYILKHLKQPKVMQPQTGKQPLQGGKRNVSAQMEASTFYDVESRHPNNLRKQVFLLLHKPVGFEYFYHLCLVTLVILSCFTLNVLKPKHQWDDDLFFEYNRLIHLIMIGLDCLLIIWLFAELLLRFWAADHAPQYYALSGKWNYLGEFFIQRLLDASGMATFLGYLIFNFATPRASSMTEHLQLTWWYAGDTVFRVAHLAQILQVYRVLYKLIRPIHTTLCQQLNQLFLAIFVVVIILIMCSQMVFLTDLCTVGPKGADHYFGNSMWHTFVTFSTLGYDGFLPYSKETLFVLSFGALIGVWAFSLPSIILGNGLSITVADQRRVTFKYLSTAEMIRTAISHQQTTRRDQMRDGTKSNQKKRSRLLMNHLKSYTKLNLMRNERLFKINYDGLDYDEHSQTDDEDLWNKLLLIDTPKGQAKRAVLPPKTQPSWEKHPNNSQPPTVSLSKFSDRLQDCFENMDLSKYSNDNSLLWYNLGLIEDAMDEMTQVVCEQMIRQLKKISKTCAKLKKSLKED